MLTATPVLSAFVWTCFVISTVSSADRPAIWCQYWSKTTILLSTEHRRKHVIQDILPELSCGK